MSREHRDLALDLYRMNAEGAIDLDQWPAAKKLVDEHTRPFAGCRACGEPLVGTFERPQLEWVCMGCGRWFGFLGVDSIPFSLEVDARHRELRAQYEAERAEREKAAREAAAAEREPVMVEEGD